MKIHLIIYLIVGFIIVNEINADASLRSKVCTRTKKNQSFYTNFSSGDGKETKKSRRES